MQINKAAFERIKSAKMSGEGFAKLLDIFVKQMENCDSNDSSITFDYQDNNDTIEDGDMIPYITIGLRQPSGVENDLPG